MAIARKYVSVGLLSSWHTCLSVTLFLQGTSFFENIKPIDAETSFPSDATEEL
jgi:hypothetical protein